MSVVAENTVDRRCHNDHLHFLRAWFRAPLRTGAIAPSSPALARSMALAAGVRPGDRVLELGPGTGVVTQALLLAGIREEDLTLVEGDEVLAAMMQQRYPAATVICGDAFAVVENLVRTEVSVAAVVSSLPLFVYPRQKRAALCVNALQLMAPHGRMVQFTYSLVSPVPRRKNVHREASRRIWGNLPPAVVWTYQAQGGHRSAGALDQPAA